MPKESIVNTEKRLSATETVSSRTQRAGKSEDTTENQFSIGQLSREFNVTLRTLRFYEDRGLISPKREGTTRVYSRRDRARLKLVLMGKKVGFSLTEIREMLDLYDLKDGQVVQLRVALKRFQEQVDVLRQQKDDIEQGIEELERTVDVVAGMLREKEIAAG
ncbi:MAG: transcriptional regulator [Hyphomicrobiales bacterium]|nr:MAG: transcriptional regulator [Hyphomicrobiales bacterium]